MTLQLAKYLLSRNAKRTDGEAAAGTLPHAVRLRAALSRLVQRTLAKPSPTLDLASAVVRFS